MSLDFDIRHFYRKAPRACLQDYFKRLGLLQEFDWTSIGVRKIAPLHEAWLALDEQDRARTAEDFRNLSLIGTPNGKVAIIDEAIFHGEGESVATMLGELPDPLDCAFWILSEKPHLWDGAIFFAASDFKPPRMWRKRSNMPRLGRETTEAEGGRLAKELSDLFTRIEGRGRHCVVHQYRRGEREYYFAYPQDHPMNSQEYDELGQWTKRPYNPAFEIIFIHDDAARTLRIWHDGNARRVQDLEVAFAKAVLETDIPKVREKDTRVYDLDAFAGEFQFVGLTALGIESAEVRRIRVSIHGPNPHSILINLGQMTPSRVLYDRLRHATAGLKPTEWSVSQVGLEVTFEMAPGERKRMKGKFQITSPNSLSLGDEGRDLLMQRMLLDNGIEPRVVVDSGDE